MDTRDWARERRDRTRHLIELGGLVTKAGLVELVDDDRATLLGALLELAGKLQHGDDEATPAQLRARWRHAGLRAFHQEREAEAETQRQVQGSRGVPQSILLTPSPAPDSTAPP